MSLISFSMNRVLRASLCSILTSPFIFTKLGLSDSSMIFFPISHIWFKGGFLIVLVIKREPVLNKL